MHGLINWAVSRARMVLAFVALTVLAGFVAYTTLPNEGDPQIDAPFLYVSVGLPGASASDVERLMIKPLETELKAIPGLVEMTATASEGHAGVLLRFDYGWDKAATLADARDRVDRAQAELPEDALEAEIFEISTAEFPIITVSVFGQAPERTLLRVAQDLERRFEAISTVAEVNMSGQREEVLEVVVDPLKLEAYGVAAEDLLATVRRNNQLIAAGAIEDENGRFSVSLPGSLDSAGDITSIVLRRDGDRTVTIGDLAELRLGFKDRTSYARFDGAPTIALSVEKRAGESTIETVAAVRAVVAEAQADWPEELRNAISVDFSFDRSQEAADMAGQLQNSVLTAVCLVMLVVFASLGFRSAMLVGFAVPCSFLLTFALLGAMGMSVNSMVLFGLILAVGMLVDGAIVVAEYADRRAREGAEPTAAYAEAARRMAWPVTSSTATTLCAFLPMLFWPGGAGEWMSLLPITIIFVLSASLLVALIYLPVIGGVFGAGVARVGRTLALLAGRERSAEAGAPIAPENRPLGRTAFGRGVGRVVRSPGLSLLAILFAVGTLFFAGGAYSTYGSGVEFFVDTIPERAILNVRARGNLSVEESDRILREVEAIALEADGVASVFASSNASNGPRLDGGGGAPADTIGSIRMEFEPWRDLRRRATPLSGDDIIAAIMARAERIPGVFVEVTEQQAGPPQGKPVQLELSAPSQDRLAAAVDAVRARFDADPELLDVEDSRSLPGIEWRLEVDRREAGRFGADIASIGAIAVLATRGYTIDTFTPDDSNEEIDIVARFPEGARGLETLAGLRVQTNDGLAPVSNFVTREAAPLVGEIVRRDGRNFLVVSANVVDGVNANEKIAEIGDWLAERAAADPGAWAGVSAQFGGDQEEQAESQAFLGQAFIGALGLMFIILLAQFNSFYESALVLSAVVMSIAGVLIGLIVMGQPFSIIMTGVGVVALAGIVVNNNIVLIDTYHDYRKRMDRIDAIAKTVEDRLRPVLLTTFTTIAGLLPMMFAASIDFSTFQLVTGAPSAIWWVPLATAVVFGLGFSTILTLIVTPSALALRVHVGRALKAVLHRAVARRRRGRTQAAPGPAPQPAPIAATPPAKAGPDEFAPAE